MFSLNFVDNSEMPLNFAGFSQLFANFPLIYGTVAILQETVPGFSCMNEEIFDFSTIYVRMFFHLQPDLSWGFVDNSGIPSNFAGFSQVSVIAVIVLEKN